LTVAAFMTATPSLRPLPSAEPHASPAGNLHPKDVHFRIFHPPRA
jgi:hypothetical protein